MTTKILIIDDQAALRYLFSFDLQKKGYDTISANSGEKGLEMAKAEKPDLILLDIMLPGISGVEVCKRLKADPATQGIPVIMITAKSQARDVEQGLEAGAHDYLVKPIPPEDLFVKIQAALE